jgi:hypothetical protein
LKTVPAETSAARATSATVTASKPRSDLIWGGWNVVGGTSVASPIIASVYALAGNAQSVVYGSYPYSHTKYLFDVTEGQNFPDTTTCGYLCQAGAGYDGPTGLGTPNGFKGF